MPLIFLATTPTSAKQRGMTLIELLVAVALLAIVASLAYRGLDNLSLNSRHLGNQARHWQDLALFFNRFAHDVAQPVARPIHVGPPQENQDSTALAGQRSAQARNLAEYHVDALKALRVQADHSQADSLPAWLGRPARQQLAGSTQASSDLDLPPLPNTSTNADRNTLPSASLEFTRKSATGRDEIRLAYRLRNQRIELLLWPVLDRRDDHDHHTDYLAGQPDDNNNKEDARAAIHPLLDGVSALYFHHLDDNNNWQDHWPPAGAPADLLPRAVAIELILQDGTQLRRIFALPS